MTNFANVEGCVKFLQIYICNMASYLLLSD